MICACGEDDPNEFYYERGRNGVKRRRKQCKSCTIKRSVQYAKDHPDQTKKKDADFRQRHPGYMRQVRYGVSNEHVVSIYKRQGGRCAICCCVIDVYKAHLDHDHATGIFRGLLCGPCNTALGLVHDNLDWMKRAVEYLSSSI